MKRVLVAVAVASLAACSSVKSQNQSQVLYTPMPVVAQTAPAPVVPPAEAAVVRTISQIPDWFVDIPKVENTIHAVGDGVSGSVSGAIAQARANAFEGICQAAGGKVSSQTKIFRQDTEKSSTSYSTTAIRNLCPSVDVTGATVEKRKIIQDGSRYRAFVLVALPVGEANKLARQKHSDKMDELSLTNKEREFKELDERVDRETAPKRGEPVSQAAPSSIQLMDVDNAEYKRRRDEALQKPGAVIGQITVR
jgi:hypothetical protein